MSLRASGVGGLEHYPATILLVVKLAATYFVGSLHRYIIKAVETAALQVWH